ncbi:MAG: enoyl-CoA hydratase [Proteobacteria bacterium]|jgi:enoyl-CoA hydratase|nr:enoyl-CoA hydratase [Pseudomonadota bacterium]MDA0960619.1 enoyl-CoA hydratase [Pseudomonadota bacterium]MDA1151667.1 enoyl-CoA hydratase [Pseudomonadota bacterium]
MTEKVIVEQSGSIARIIFNQPEKRNAVSLEMWDAVEAALDRFSVDETVRVLIISGAGGKAFVSGADISKFESERSSEVGVARYNDTTRRVYDKVETFPKPTIAQIDGFCVGGGVALAVCCDIRICGSGSNFAIPAARLGLGYGFRGINRLANLIGPAFAKEIFFTARRYNANEAKLMGLVNQVVEDGTVGSAAEEMASMICENAPLTVDAVKYIANQTRMEESQRNLGACEAMVKACFDSEDYIEGRRAFMEKRKPIWKGR